MIWPQRTIGVASLNIEAEKCPASDNPTSRYMRREVSGPRTDNTNVQPEALPKKGQPQRITWIEQPDSTPVCLKPTTTESRRCPAQEREYSLPTSLYHTVVSKYQRKNAASQ